MPKTPAPTGAGSSPFPCPRRFRNVQRDRTGVVRVEAEPPTYPAILLAKRTAWSQKGRRPPLPPVRECRLRAAGSPALTRRCMNAFTHLPLEEISKRPGETRSPVTGSRRRYYGAEHAACNRGASRMGGPIGA